MQRLSGAPPIAFFSLLKNSSRECSIGCAKPPLHQQRAGVPSCFMMMRFAKSFLKSNLCPPGSRAPIRPLLFFKVLKHNDAEEKDEHEEDLEAETGIDSTFCTSRRNLQRRQEGIRQSI